MGLGDKSVWGLVLARPRHQLVTPLVGALLVKDEMESLKYFNQ